MTTRRRLFLFPTTRLFADWQTQGNRRLPSAALHPLLAWRAVVDSEGHHPLAHHALEVHARHELLPHVAALGEGGALQAFQVVLQGDGLAWRGARGQREES